MPKLDALQRHERLVKDFSFRSWSALLPAGKDADRRFAASLSTLRQLVPLLERKGEPRPQDISAKETEELDRFLASFREFSNLSEDEYIFRPIISAFRKTGLDMARPDHWLILMSVLSWSHFPEKRSSGDHVGWEDSDYAGLLQAVDRQRSSRRLNEKAALEALIKIDGFKAPKSRRGAGNSGKLKLSGLKSAMRRAKSVDFNHELRKLVRKDMTERAAELMDVDSETREAVLAKYQKERIAHHIKEISGMWRTR